MAKDTTLVMRAASYEELSKIFCLHDAVINNKNWCRDHKSESKGFCFFPVYESSYGPLPDVERLLDMLDCNGIIVDGRLVLVARLKNKYLRSGAVKTSSGHYVVKYEDGDIDEVDLQEYCSTIVYEEMFSEVAIFKYIHGRLVPFKL